jgi:Family of unknown function (DUF6152)
MMLAMGVAALALGMASRATWAHHSFGVVYDEHKPVTLTGVITKIEWTNPHSFIFLDVKSPDGKVENWNFEGYPPGVLFRNGWKKDATMKVGDTVTIFGWQARKGGPVGHARQVTFADGTKKYFGPGPGTGDGGAAPQLTTPPVPDTGTN